MNLGLQGRCAVVTGASRGIGKAIALKLAEEGVSVAICGRSAADLRATELELQKIRPGGVFAQTCDVGKPDALNAFLDASRLAFGRIDILVNNATGYGFSEDEAGWGASLGVDLMAAVRASWKVAPWMEAQGGGAIVHMASVAGLEAGAPPAYAAAKAALISHSNSLAVALAPRKIRVNAVAPGAIEFPGGFWQQVKMAAPEDYQACLRSIPSGRLGSAEEVADAVLYLASDRASWITGSCLVVDGGQHRGNN